MSAIDMGQIYLEFKSPVAGPEKDRQPNWTIDGCNRTRLPVRGTCSHASCQLRTLTLMRKNRLQPVATSWSADR